MRTTKRLILLEPQKTDVKRYFEIHSDPRTNLFNPNGPIKNIETANNKIKEIIKHWETYKFGTWKIAEKRNPNFIIGFGGLDYIKYGDTLRLNLGYRFEENSWGNGYATELSEKAISFGFKDLNKKEIFGLVRPQHLASIRVLEKCGLIKNSELDDVPNKEKSIVYLIKNMKIKEN